MAVERVLDLDGRDVLAARDDDVLGAVLDLRVAVGMHHREVARVEPAAAEGILGGLRVLQITLHGDVAAEEDLPHGLAVGRNRLERRRIEHHHVLLHHIGHALPAVELGLALERQRLPFAVLGAHTGRAVHLGEAVDVGEIEAHPRHPLDHRDRGGRAGDEGGHLVFDPLTQFDRGVDQHVVHDRRAAVQGDAMLADQPEDRRRVDPAQAHVDPGERGDGPGEAPAVAVEHRQGPEVDRVLRQAAGDGIADGVEIGTAVVSHDPLRVARRPRGVGQRDRIPLVVRQGPAELRIAAREEGLVLDLAEQARARIRGLVLTIFRAVVL